MNPSCECRRTSRPLSFHSSDTRQSGDGSGAYEVEGAWTCLPAPPTTLGSGPALGRVESPRSRDPRLAPHEATRPRANSVRTARDPARPVRPRGWRAGPARGRGGPAAAREAQPRPAAGVRRGRERRPLTARAETEIGAATPPPLARLCRADPVRRPTLARPAHRVERWASSSAPTCLGTPVAGRGPSGVPRAAKVS